MPQCPLSYDALTTPHRENKGACNKYPILDQRSRTRIFHHTKESPTEFFLHLALFDQYKIGKALPDHYKRGNATRLLKQ